MSNPVNPTFDSRAVSVYDSGDALDDFPVLKAFQQYIDAEQAKARKRLLAMGVFFGVLTSAVIAIFVILLLNVTSRNQQLNDRLVEFAMKDRSSGSAVVVQPPQDSAAILALTTKLETLQGKLAETQGKADKALAEAEEKVRQARAAAEAAKPKEPSPEELEIRRLKAQLAAEREKAAAEKERRREEELEAYRRKHYPELYGTKRADATREVIDQILDELDRAEDEDDGDETDEATSVDDLEPIRYFEDSGKSSRPKSSRPTRKSESPLPSANAVSVPNGETRVEWVIPD